MAVQLKRQGAVNAASCSDSPLKPTSLAYGEPAIDSAGYLYIGNGKGQVVSRVRYADSTGTASTSNYSSLANNSNALSGLKIGTGVWNINTGFIPWIQKDGVMEVGKYIDFHQDQNSSADYNIRLNSSDSSLYITKTGGSYADIKIGSIQMDTSSANNCKIDFRSNNSSLWKIGIQDNLFTFLNSSSSNSILQLSDKIVTINGNTERSPLILNSTNNSGAEITFKRNGERTIVIGEGSGTGNKGTFGVYSQEHGAMFYTDNSGYCHATRMYNAVYNDYAELFPKGEDTEPGDIIALDINSDKEQYIKATLYSKKIVGVHSNEYGHLIGGDEPPKGVDFEKYNFKKYIPVGLVGRCKVKVIGKVNKGDDIIPSEIPGIGRSWIGGMDSQDLLKNSIGFAVESSDDKGVKLIKVKLRG